MDILLETYSYISFKDRVFTTVEILKDIFDYTIEHAAEIRRICDEGERARPDPVGIAYGPPVSIGDCEILAWDMDSQRARRIPGREPRRYRMPHLAKFVPTKTARRPAAYLVPAELPRVLEKLEHHGIRLERLTAPRRFPGELDRVSAVSKTASPDVGSMTREETVVRVVRESDPAAARAGDVLVPTDQVQGTLAVYLLEPESDDGLLRWGYFDAEVRVGAPLPVRRVLAL
jgi:hypothetical protein